MKSNSNPAQCNFQREIAGSHKAESLTLDAASVDETSVSIEANVSAPPAATAVPAADSTLSIIEPTPSMLSNTNVEPTKPGTMRFENAMDSSRELVSHNDPRLSAADKELIKEGKRAMSVLISAIQGMVIAGFYSESEIIDRVKELVSHEFTSIDATALIEGQTVRCIAKKQEDMKIWPSLTDCDRLDKACAELERRGVTFRQNVRCDPDADGFPINYGSQTRTRKASRVRGYAFYLEEDTCKAVNGGALDVHFVSVDNRNAAARRIGHEICEVLRSHKLDAKWNGGLPHCIEVNLDWRRRWKSDDLSDAKIAGGK